MSARDAVTALRRFGLGSRPGEPARIASDPRGFVLAQLDGGALPEFGDLLTSAQLWQGAERFRVFNRKRRQGQKESGEDAAGTDEIMDGATTPTRPNVATRLETTARLHQAVTTDQPLIERLVGFWSNHFSVSMQGFFMRFIAGAYEREAIRPNILGSFHGLLHAVVRHPGMLVYLDNQRSIGPNSRAGQRRGRGLNENLAREILELHTLGVNGGYGQEDVVNLARALTGWTVSVAKNDRQGTFRFNPQWHEPGAVTIMGRTYPEGGIEQAEAVLDDLAAHPETARHVARKLALHFVGEEASPSLVDGLAAEFERSDGDLAALTRLLVSSDEAWLAEARKVLPPYDFVVAVFRALDEEPKFEAATKALRTFGHIIWRAPSPAGWPDGDEAWASPHAVLERLDWVKLVAAGSSESVGADIRVYAEDLFAGTLSDFTRQAIVRAESRQQALALLFMSSEFQRR